MLHGVVSSIATYTALFTVLNPIVAINKWLEQDDELTDTIVSLQFLWLLSNVPNGVKTKVLHKTIQTSITTLKIILAPVKLSLMMYTVGFKQLCRNEI